MLSAFPYLLSWSELSPLLIRVTLGAVFSFWAYRTFRRHDSSVRAKTVGVLEALVAVLLIIGLWTQVAALVAAVDLIIRLVKKIKARAFLTDGVNYYLILLVLALSLIVTGAGFLARDIPL